uniref:Uncharacterized protein n=1 Tax=viral metagenome TaxID=1070528 RepID=A0A6C0CIB6_9ZZZZ
MIKSLLTFLLPALIHGFSNLTPPTIKPIIINPSVPKPIIVGSTEPVPNFDPLNFSKDESKLPYLREAELKHGRIAMVASSLMPITELITNEKSIHNFDKLPTTAQSLIISSMFMGEFASMIKGWKNPYTNPFELKDDYQPGDFGFRIYRNLESDETKDLLNKELNNGRMAMIGALGMIVQELVTDKQLF